MNWGTLVFIIIFGLAAIWFGWRVFMTSSMVRSALSLLASMSCVGCLFFALQAEFLAVLQIMMMATEMSIMAIFMMMYMMDPGGMGEMDMSHQKKPSIIAATLLGCLALGAILLTDWQPTSTNVPTASRQNHDLGIEIMKRSMMIFETAGVTILTAMIASAATALVHVKNDDGDPTVQRPQEGESASGAN